MEAEDLVVSLDNRPQRLLGNRWIENWDVGSIGEAAPYQARLDTVRPTGFLRLHSQLIELELNFGSRS